MSRFQYPTNLRSIRILCTGQIDSVLLLETFIRGADGVFVGGCRLGECHYFDGNYQAQLKVKMTKKLLRRAGFQDERLVIEFMSSAEAERYAKLVTEFAERIRELGPTPVLSGEQQDRMRDELRTLQIVMSNYRLRALMAKKRRVVEGENVYGDSVPEREMEKILQEAIDAEYIRNRILLLTKDESKSCVELSELINVPSEKVLRNITYLRRKNLLDLHGVEGTTPLYKKEAGV